MTRRISRVLDGAANGVHVAGKKVAGERGVKAAKTVSKALLGRHLEPCSDACGWCNTDNKESL